MAREWRTWADAIRYYEAEGFEIAVVRCSACGKEAVYAFWPGSTVMDCTHCGAMAATPIRRTDAEH